MAKSLFITEKPSVAQAFAKALNVHPTQKTDGYIEDDKYIITWCVGHLITMSYPEAYGEQYKNWSLDTLPFIPQQWKYEVISNVSKQFSIVKKLLNRSDVSCIYNCGDSAREGEYIQRLVFQQAHVNPNAMLKRVWIDSQTDEEILKGIREAKSLSAYDNLAKSGYMRAKEDYLIGINFSRLLTLLYAYNLKTKLNLQKCFISVGRVMTCVLGMIVQREQEINSFKKTAYYGVKAEFDGLDATWKSVEGSKYEDSLLLYNENGFYDKKDAQRLVDYCKGIGSLSLGTVERKDEKKYAPLLFNLAELQAECSKVFKISPDATLNAVQSLYEGKMVTYPRTDARVLSTAISKEIEGNIKGLSKVLPSYSTLIDPILQHGSYKTIMDTKYCDDSKISDHYAIIPTGQKASDFTPSELQQGVYEMIVRRFLAIFYPCAIYDKCAVTYSCGQEKFFANYTGLKQLGYLAVAGYDKEKDKTTVINRICSLPIGSAISPVEFVIHDMETKPPTRYTSGSIILAMENAGKLIEEEELREQIKDCGIGTSATRAEIIKKLSTIGYINQNNKTQILSPTSLGTEVCRVVANTIPTLLSPKMTANWEQGLNSIANGTLSDFVYYDKLTEYLTSETDKLKTNAPKVEVLSAPDGNGISQNITCPLCKKGVVKMNDKALYCTEYKNGCKFTIWKKQFGKELTDKQLADLLLNKKTGKIKFKKKDGTEYTASLIYENNEVRFAPRESKGYSKTRVW